MAAFSHAARAVLRGERDMSQIAILLGPDMAERIALAEHPAVFVAAGLADRLHQADALGMDRFALLQAERESGHGPAVP